MTVVTSVGLGGGEFFAGGSSLLAGLGGGGVGEEGVSGGFPAGSGVGESADDERGFFVNVVLTLESLLVVLSVNWDLKLLRASPRLAELLRILSAAMPSVS